MKQIQRIVIAFIVVTIICLMYFHAPAQTIPVKIISATGVIDTTGMNLKGADGKDGRDGKDGINGKDGATGPMGPAGPAGSGSGGFAIPAFWSIAFVATFEEFEAACLKANAGSIRKILIVQSFTLIRKIRLSETPNNPSFSLNIDGCGNEIKIAAGIDTAIVRSYQSLQKATPKVGFELNVTGLWFKGNGNDICIYLSSTYNSSFDNCAFTGSKVGLELRWSLQASVTNNRFNDNTYCGLILDYDRFINGSNSASQPNHPLVMNNRFRAMPNAFAGIRCVGTSGTYIVHNIFEGGDTAHVSSDHAIYITDDGSPVVKDGYIGWNHFEAKFPVAALWMRGKDVIYYTGYNYSQYDVILIHFETTAYGHIYVESIPYLTNGTKFESIGSGARWHWSKIKFDPLLATTWLGAIPVKQEINAINPNGQTPYYNINGKNVQTAP